MPLLYAQNVALGLGTTAIIEVNYMLKLANYVKNIKYGYDENSRSTNVKF